MHSRDIERIGHIEAIKQILKYKEKNQVSWLPL